MKAHGFAGWAYAGTLIATLTVQVVGAAPPTLGAGDGQATDPARAVPEHTGITEYLGPETCVACHRPEALAMHGSVHYQQTGPTPNVPNIPGFAGERGFGDIGFNTYCGTHTTSSRATCGSCHVGNGRFPEPVATDTQLNNIDCLMCHQDAYQRKAAPPFQTVPVVGPDGQPASIQVPIEDETGFDYEPDTAAMAIPILAAARTVHLPTRASCLRCHAGASGSDGGKRGDLSLVTVAPPRSSDIHMSPQGENLTCADCHAVGGHRVRGRGLDLRPNDVLERFTCESCHTDRPHGDYSARNGVRRDTHAMRVACQSCHIPTYAKDVTTEMERDWNNPFYSPAACSGQGGWKPEEIRAGDVVPSYAWFDGTSDVYVLGQIPLVNAAGEYSLAIPRGSVSADGAKLHPMKEHRSTSGMLAAVTGDVDGDGVVNASDFATLSACLAGPGQVAPACAPADLDGDSDVDLGDYGLLQICFNGGCGTPGELIPHSTFTFFATGDFPAAVEDGMAQVGMRGTWLEVPVHTYQTINHGVEEEDSALNCGACHASLSGGPVRMNLTGELGYGLKGPQSQVCFQCHGAEEPKPFRTIHEKHVTDKGYDCSWCHNFSRPQRNLTLP